MKAVAKTSTRRERILAHCTDSILDIHIVLTGLEQLSSRWGDVNRPKLWRVDIERDVHHEALRGLRRRNQDAHQ